MHTTGPRSAIDAALACAVITLLAFPGVLRAQQEAATASVTGVVGDAVTGGPLPSAAVELPEIGLRTLTDAEGRFILRGIPAGEHRWVIRQLGYATWEQVLEVENLERLRIGLLPRPVALESITATVSRLQDRRKLAAVGVHTVTREEVRSSIATHAEDLVRSRMHWLPAPCPPAHGGASLGLCIRSRGGVHKPAIYLDERPVPFELLFAYAADEIHEIDYFGGGPTAQIRVYTRYFLESGKRLRPLGFR